MPITCPYIDANLHLNIFPDFCSHTYPNTYPDLVSLAYSTFLVQSELGVASGPTEQH
jgi:hypothetical protein